MTDDPIWMNPSDLQIGKLEDKTAPGVFVSSLGPLIWIVPTPEGPFGVRLSEGPGQFILWKLEPGHGDGVHLGPVELELDASAFEFVDGFPVAGDLVLEGNSVQMVGATDAPHFRAPRLTVANIKDPQGPSHAYRCKHWSLVRRSDDEKQIIFERRGATPA